MQFGRFTSCTIHHVYISWFFYKQLHTNYTEYHTHRSTLIMVKLHWHDNLKDSDPFSYLSTYICFGISITPHNSVTYRDSEAKKNHIDT